MADEAGFELGRAFVSVDPDAADFDEKLAEQIGSPVVLVRVEPDMGDFDAKVDEEAGGHTATVRVDADTGPAREQVDELVSSGLPKDTTFTVDADTGPARGALDELSGTAQGTQEQMDKLAAGADAASGALGSMGAESRSAGEAVAAGAEDVRAFADELAQVDTELREFAGAAGETAGGADALSASVARLAGDLSGLQASGGVTAAELATLRGELGSVTSELDVLEGAAGTTAAALGEVGQAAAGAAASIDVLNGDLAAGGARDAAGGYADLSAELGQVGEAGVVAASGVRATSEALAEANESAMVTATELAQLDAKVGDLFPAVGDLTAQFQRLGLELDEINSYGGADAAVLENLQMRITATGAAVDELEAEIPGLLAEMEALPPTVSAAAVSLSMLNREAAETAIANLGTEAEDGAVAVTTLGASAGSTTSIFHMFSQVLTKVALSPWTWAVVGAAAVAALSYEMLSGTSELDEYTTALQRQYHATGDNLAGYEAYNRAIQDGGPALKELATATEQVSPAMERFGTSAGSAAVQTHDLTTAQQQSAAEVSNLGDHLSALEGRYGDTQVQAERLAGAAHVSASALAEGGSAAEQAMQKIEAYGDANEGARGKVSEMSNDMLTFGNDALTAKDRIGGLDDAFNMLVGNFVSSQQAQLQVQSDFLTIASNAKQAGASMTGANQASVTLQQSFLSSIPDIEAAANAMLTQGASTAQVTQYLQDQAVKLGEWTGSSQVATQALQDFKLWEDETYDSTGKLSDELNRASQTLEDQFIVQVEHAGVQSSVAKQDVNGLATAVMNTGTQSNATADARAKMIAQLEQSGVKASVAKTDVDNFTKSLGKIPREVAAHITVTGKGQWSVSESNIYPTPSGKAPPPPIGVIPPKAAAGMMVTGGTPGRDSVLISAMPGELVVPTGMVKAGAVDHLRGSIPGFAAGGVVSAAHVGGSYGGTATGSGAWADSEDTATNQAVIVSVEQAMGRAINSKIAGARASAGGGGRLHLTGSGATVEALMKSMAASVGWTGALWNDLYNVEMAEAGFNLNARNPGSGAYGLAQFINGPGEYAQYGGNATTARGQITGMLNYIKDRYGSPAAAWQHEQQYHWYRNGGWLQPGAGPINETGRPEAVLTPEESAAFVQLVKALVGHGGAAGGAAGAGAQVNVNYYGTQAPTPEQEQAMLLKLSAAIGVA